MAAVLERVFDSSQKPAFLARDKDGNSRLIPQENFREVKFNLKSAKLKEDDSKDDSNDGDQATDEEKLIGDDLILELSVSSEEPYLRWWFYEILDHSDDAINLERFKDNKANALFNHHPDKYIGVIVKYWIEEKKLYVHIKFSKNGLASTIVDDINDGILSNASIQYSVDEVVLEKEEKGDFPYYRVTKWTIYEAGIVTIPADATVGVGKSTKDILTSKGEDNLSSKNNGEPKDEIKTSKIEGKDMGKDNEPSVNLVEIRENEILRVQGLLALGQKFAHLNVEELIQKAIKEERSIEHVRSEILDLSTKHQESLAKPSEPLGFSEKEQRNYSVIRAINAAVSGSFGKDAGFEKEVHLELAKRAAKFNLKQSDETNERTFSVHIPFYDLMINPRMARVGAEMMARGTAIRDQMTKAYYQSRAFEVGTAAQGGYLVETSLDDTRFIDIFRNTARVLRAGATTLTGLIGNVDIPRQTAGVTDGSNVFWVAEDQDVGEITAQFGLLNLRPKTLGAFMRVTRLMLLQSSIDIEMFMRRELATYIALGVDSAALEGTGSADEPLGIFNTPGVNAVEFGTNGDFANWTKMVEFETRIATVNALADAMGWMGNARIRGDLKTIEKFDGTNGNPIYDTQNNTVNGYPFWMTNQVRGDYTKGTGTNLSGLVFGNWSEIIFGEWGSTEILANPYETSVYLAGSVLLRIMHTCDIVNRHPESFSAATDVATQV